MWRLRPSRSASDVVRQGFPQGRPFQLPKPEADRSQSGHDQHVELIGERDNAHDIQAPHEKEAGQNGDDFVVHRRGKATTPTVSTSAASTPLPPDSIDTAKTVVASRRMRP